MSGRVHAILDRGETYGYLRGYGSRDLLLSVGSRPTWGSVTRAWAGTYGKVRDAIALAESRGWVVTVEWTGERRATRPPVVVLPAVSEPEPGQGVLFDG